MYSLLFFKFWLYNFNLPYSTGKFLLLVALPANIYFFLFILRRRLTTSPPLFRCYIPGVAIQPCSLCYFKFDKSRDTPKWRPDTWRSHIFSETCVQHCKECRGGKVMCALFVTGPYRNSSSAIVEDFSKIRQTVSPE